MLKKSVKVNEGSLGNTIFMKQFYFVWTTPAFFNTYFPNKYFYKNTPFSFKVT